MSSTACRRIKRGKYSEETLKKALAEAREKKRPIRQISREYNIPKTTLLDRITGRTTDALKRPGPDPILGKEGEKKLVKWILDLTKCGFPMKKDELFDTVQSLIKESGIKSKFKDDRPGQTWYQNFLERNKEISQKNAEGNIKARSTVTEESIRIWFEELEQYLENIGHRDILENPTRIFSGDESSFVLCPKVGEVLGPREHKNGFDPKPGDEEEYITVLITFNANGDVCPPSVIFPYDRAPTAVGKQESGWIRADVFCEYITNDFNDWVVSNHLTKPVLLLVDGFKSHMSLMLSTLCNELEIILYALPPNTSHLLQPADGSVFAPLKTYWKNTVRQFLSKPENLYSSVTKANFCTLLEETLQEPSMPESIRNSFLCCGIYPFNPDSVDYSQCSRKTSKKVIASKHKHYYNHITMDDIATTIRVLKHLKPALKKSGVNVRTVMKEIKALKESLPENETEITFLMETVTESSPNSN